MPEVWLRSNRRVISLGFIPMCLLALGSLQLFLSSSNILWQGLAIAFFALSLMLTATLIKYLVSPRVAYADGKVLFYLQSGAPIRVPVDVVEAFFLGQGPAHLPLGPSNSEVTVNLVARLSQKYPQWAEIEVKPALACWSEGYISIRGSWCEPLSVEVVRRLNRRLGEVSREQVEQAKRSS